MKSISTGARQQNVVQRGKGVFLAAMFVRKRQPPSTNSAEASMTTLTLRRPDDWHLHLRDGAVLKAVLPHSSAHFARAIVMPNLVPPVVTSAQAAAYRARILAALPAGHDFSPLMTLYLTEATDPADVVAGFRGGVVSAVKLYPAGATTNSQSGVRDFETVVPVLEAMAEAGVPLCVHGEVTDPAVDIFDREATFIDRVLDPLRRKVPGLRVVMEHVTTKEGVAYARSGGDGLAATITPSSTATPSSRAASARITTACRSPSARRTVWRCARRRPRATRTSSSAPIPRRISTR
jgi:dihydroorotase (homodimeric type)